MAYLPRFSRSLTAAVVGGATLLSGAIQTGAQAATATPAATASPAPTPVQPTSFDATTARLDKGGTFYLYLSTAQWLDRLSTTVINWRDLALESLPKDQKNAADRQKIEQGFAAAAKWVKQSGIEEITGFGASSVALEPGVNRNVAFVHHAKDGEDKFLFGTAFGSKPHALTALDYLPADTAYGHYGDLDLSRILRSVYDMLEGTGIPEVKKELDNGLTQFQQMSGMSADEVLQSLGGSGGIVLTLDPDKPVEVTISGEQKQKVPYPRLALLLAMNDDKIFARLDGVFGGFPGIIKVDEPGLRMRTMSYAAMPDFTVRPTVAQWDKFLVIASDDGLIRDMIAAQKSGQGLKVTPEFTKLTEGMPTEGNGFTVVTQTFGETIKQVQAETMKQSVGNDPGQLALFKKLYAGQNVGDTYTVSAHVEDGWLSVSKGGQSVNQVLVPLAIVPAAIAAGVALPMYQSIQAKTVNKAGGAEAVAKGSEANAKQLALACKIYANDNDGKFPPTLDALVPTYVSRRSLFISPFKPGEKMGYKYTPGLTADSPAQSVLLEDKFAGEQQQRVVAHVDGSTEVIKVP